MENKNSFTNNLDASSEEKLILSYELLKLMEWLVEHEAEALKKIIARGLKHGLYEKLQKAQSNKKLLTSDDIQNHIIDFLGLLEVLLFESTNEQMVNSLIQKNLMPSIDHVDTINCDLPTVQTSLAVVTSKLERNPKENAQELFLKELIKRWKPSKKAVEN